MNKDEAQKVVDAFIEENGPLPITLEINGRIVQVTEGDMSIIGKEGVLLTIGRSSFETS